MPGDPPPLVSVISLTHNRCESLAALLDALRHQDYRPFETIVVDNASTDGTRDMVRSSYPEVRLIERPTNEGNYAYNDGVRSARGEFLMLIDDDGLPASSGWVSQLVARFEANPRLGAAACTIRMADTGKVAFDSPQFDLPPDASRGYPCVAYNGTGAGLRAAALRDIGILYPAIFLRSYIELHACTRLWDLGWEVRMFPEIEVWHCRKSGTSNPLLAYYGLRNYYFYIWTLYPWPSALTETLHHFGSRAKLTIMGKVPVRRFLAATRDAIRDLPAAQAGRRPVSPATVHYLRSIRRLGKRPYDPPEVVPFGPPMPLEKRTG